jgi:hypothetical protein
MKRLTKKEQVAVIEGAIYSLELGSEVYICTALARNIEMQGYTHYACINELHIWLPTIYKAILKHGNELIPGWFPEQPWFLDNITSSHTEYRIDWLKAYLTKLKK